MKPSNVFQFAGAMRRRPLLEGDLDDRLAENRERYHAAFEAQALGLGVPEKRAKPSVIPLDNSLLARALRWLRNLSLKGPL